ncbi:flagellar FliJ family protein [Thalassospiraceae bacterium LMO-JJ14]|nr:flagellar FliJ family protein [Thalassospiraceae bacterium LMO-JJ14]
MARDFKALVRLNDWEVDQKRRYLAEQLRQLDNLIGLLENLEAELKREQAHAASAPTEGGIFYGAYAAQAILRREDYQRRIAEQEQQVSAAREQLRLAFLEFKKFEISEERRVARMEAEANREEQLELDEIGITGFNRKKRGHT